jgi:hypothetical protein
LVTICPRGTQEVNPATRPMPYQAWKISTGRMMGKQKGTELLLVCRQTARKKAHSGAQRVYPLLVFFRS